MGNLEMGFLSQLTGLTALRASYYTTTTQADHALRAALQVTNERMVARQQSLASQLTAQSLGCVQQQLAPPPPELDPWSDEGIMAEWDEAFEQACGYLPEDSPVQRRRLVQDASARMYAAASRTQAELNALYGPLSDHHAR